MRMWQSVAAWERFVRQPLKFKSHEWIDERKAWERDLVFEDCESRQTYLLFWREERPQWRYVSITESKRVKEGTKDVRPVLEKHKIFLYREDMEKFTAAFEAVAGFVEENSPVGLSHPYGGGHSDFVIEGQQPEVGGEYETDDNDGGDGFRTGKSVSEFRFDIDFWSVTNDCFG